jgi:nitroreductase
MMDQAQIMFDVMYSRRSIRRYKAERPVEQEKINLLLKAAMAAPSACNLQPWEFIVIDEEEGLNRLKDCIDPEHGRNYNAPVAFVVCGNTSYIPWESDGAMDCSAAIENMLLAATALELGAVWIGAVNGEAVRTLLDIPAHVAVISVVFFGYPAEQKPPRTQYNEEAVYWQKYDPNRDHPPRSTDLRFL